MIRFRHSAGQNPFRIPSLALLRIALLCLIVGLQPAAAVHAQQAEIAIDVPGGSLADALNAFASQAGLTLSFDPALVQGRTAPALKGAYSVEAALKQLLAGTHLVPVINGSAVIIKPAPAPRTQGEALLPEVSVQATEVSRPGDLPQPYAGGQVARGGQVGVLGNKDMMDTPFNQTSYTSKLMQDQQAYFMADALKNDPSVGIVQAPSSGVDWFSIRGFSVSNTDVLLNGMAGVAPTFANSMMAESIDRVEVLKGPSALLNGMAPGGSVGGTVNIVPKRAGDDPLTQFTASYGMDSQLGAHVDVARRYGPDKAFGVRLNAAYRDGDTPIENQSRESQLATLALDYRGEKLRLSSDLGYQYQHLQGQRGGSVVAFNGAVPDAPDSRRSYFSPWEQSEPEVYYGTLRGEYDIAENLTAFAAIGENHREMLFVETFRSFTNANGDLAAGNAFIRADKMISKSTDVGIRGSFDTGPVSHQATVAYSGHDREWRMIYGPGHAFPASNIYQPIHGNGPDPALLPDPDDARKTQDLALASTAIGDTLSILNERVQLTLGARFQEVNTRSFNAMTGAGTASYDEDAVTPMVGLVVKPWKHVSLYGNYIEGLQPGATAPNSAANAGEIFSPYVTKQYEAGAKMESGKTTTTVAIYQIALPSAFLDPVTNIFGVDGEQRHRGLDLNVFGEVTDGIRLLGGVAYVDSELTKTAGGTNDGNTGIGAPRVKLVAGAEWDAPFLEGLTLTGRATYNSSAYLDAANLYQVPGWTRFDIGARYRIAWAQGNPVIVRASVDNVFGADYWIPDSGGGVTLSDPMTFKVSATFDF